MSDVSRPRLSPLAVTAFVLGMLSLVLTLAAALPALFLGVQAIRTINRADGRLRGQRLALVGLVLAAIVTLVSVFGIVALILLKVQETSLDAGCKNNLRQLGLAIEAYAEDRKAKYPPGTVLNPDLSPKRRLSWQAALVPYLAPSVQTGAKAKKLELPIAFNEAWDSEANAGLRKKVAPFQCPAFAFDPTANRADFTSYLGIGGVGKDAALLPLDDVNAGFFGYDRILGPGDITARLGALMTAVESRKENGPWAAGGSPTVRGLERDCERYLGTDAAFGGLHRNGANVLWADGSARLVADQVDPNVFRLEARINRP